MESPVSPHNDSDSHAQFSRSDSFAQQTIRSVRIRYLLLFDLLLIGVSVLLATTIRLESGTSAWDYLRQGGWVLLVIAPLVRLPLYMYFRLYNRLWRYAGIAELTGILRAGLIAPPLIALINFGLLPVLRLPNSPSRSVWLLEAILSLIMLAGLRISLRLVQEHRQRPRGPLEPGVPTLIVGAGDAGAMILREIQRRSNTGIHVVGFIDDDPFKYEQRLLGVPVLGSRARLVELARFYNVRQVIIAMPTAPGKIIREVVQRCEAVGIQPRIMPNMQYIVDGSLSLSQLRAVEIDDLLRRDPIHTDIESVRKLLHGERVLVTGGGGSIGRELCRQILLCQPAKLIILGHGENSIFEIEQELQRLLRKTGGSTRIISCIADIRMPARVQQVFAQYRPTIVFHAAAHKHVPLMEAHPAEAVSNNILGTRNVLDAATRMDVARFVMISTDKAVNPTNVMGASKRGAELLVLDAARTTGKPYVAVRFGNVLGSRGSVVLTFKEQIAQGGPVTITHPDVRRYFMTIPEAVQLVLQAAVLGRGGEIFMLDMGEPVRIVDLAHDLIRLSGLEVGRDIDVVHTGLRPGEKLFEELFIEGETYHTTLHPKIRIVVGAGAFVPPTLHPLVEALRQAAQQDDAQAIRSLLETLVPEYQPQPQATAPNTVLSDVPDDARSAMPDRAAQSAPAPVASSVPSISV